MAFVCEPPLKYLYEPNLKPVELYKEWISMPAGCIQATNYVSRAKLSHPIDINRFIERYPFCEIDLKNDEGISLSTRYPPRFAVIYSSGMIKFSGEGSFRSSRLIAEKYVGMIRECGYPDIDIVDYSLVNIGCIMEFPFDLDIEEYNKTRNDAIYIPGSFAGSRYENQASELASNAVITLFKEKLNVVGANSARYVCYDLMRLYDKYKRFGRPRSVSETIGTEPKRKTHARTKRFKKIKI